MKTSTRGLDIIKKHESLKLKAYLCPVKKWTIGYGHTANVHPDMNITKETADAFLIEDVVDSENFIKKYITRSLSQCEFDALVSIVFNVKKENLKNSNLLTHINNNNIEGIKKYWLMWNKGRVNGELVVLPGLVTRRQEELNLYFSNK